MDKKMARLRRARRTRLKLRALNKVRLCVHKTPRHIYAQVFSGDGSTVLACASTVENSISKECNANGGNVEAAKIVGRHIAQRSIENGVKSAGFDRSGFRYHGRVKALAESAREHGLQI